MSSVDGRLHMERWTNPVGKKSYEDIGTCYFDISADFKAQAMLVGRATFQEHYSQEIFDYQKFQPATKHENYKGKHESESFAVVADVKGKILYGEDNMWGNNIIAILSEQVSEEYMAHLREKGISYVFAGMDGNDLSKALEALRAEFGIEKLLLEGGGIINGLFLKAGLIDELSLMIYPGIDGLSSAPTIFEYHGEKDEKPAEGQTLEFTSSKVLNDGMIWLSYKFHRP